MAAAPATHAAAPIAPRLEHSRPRTDWAHVGTLKPVVSPPPLTFDGDRFGRSVAGARSMAAARHRLPSGRTAPSGIMRDAATVQDIITPAATVAGELVAHDAGVMPAAPPAPHRKSAAGRQRQSPELVTSDLTLEYPTAELKRPPVAPVTWTPDEGFVDEEPEQPRPMTMFRRRAQVRPVADPGELRDEDAPDEELLDGDVLDSAPPTVRFVPAEGRRQVAPPRDLVDLVEQVTGVHVGDAIIDRSPQVSERAAELGAIAYTEGGTVHLPAELGDIDQPEVRAVTAHELVHVAQHRLAEGELPHEESPEGHRMEGEARAVQRALAPGAPVVPAFIRSGANLPAHRTQGSSGVQRLANEASGEDFSDIDQSDIEPGSGDDRFVWQEREGEPTGVPWDERRLWDQRFETTHSTTLQAKRDEHHARLLHDLAAGGTPTREQMLAVRRQLDHDMPYQFGPPFGIQPYPELLPGETAGAGRGGGGGAGATAAVAGRAVAATVPASTAAETGRANEALRHITSRAHEQHRLHGDHGGSTMHLFEERFELERNMRWEVLSAKREAAQAEGAAGDHVVALSDDEMARIREAVDIEIPMSVAYPQYIENEYMRLSVAGQLDGPAPAGGTRGSGAGARTAGGPPGASTPGTPSTPGTGAATTPAPGTSDAQSKIEDILRDARAAQHPGEGGAFAWGDLPELYRVRFEYEKDLRRQVLWAKVAGAVHGGAEVGTLINLDQAELDRIHEAVDLAHPLALETRDYLDTDENLSHRITDEDVTNFGRQPQPAPTIDTTPTTPAPDTAPTATPAPAPTPAGAPAPPTTDTGTPADAPAAPAAPAQSQSAGAVALATGIAGLIGSMMRDEDHAGDEMAGKVVESLTEIDIEVLSRRLWERLRRELRTELLIDRERAGALADIR